MNKQETKKRIQTLKDKVKKLLDKKPSTKPKLPKVSDLLYRPKRDKDGNIIKPQPRNPKLPKLPKDRKPPTMTPLTNKREQKKRLDRAKK